MRIFEVSLLHMSTLWSKKFNYDDKRNKLQKILDVLGNKYNTNQGSMIKAIFESRNGRHLTKCDLSDCKGFWLPLISNQIKSFWTAKETISKVKDSFWNGRK